MIEQHGGKNSGSVSGKTDYILKSEYIEFSDGTITNVIWGD